MWARQIHFSFSEHSSLCSIFIIVFSPGNRLQKVELALTGSGLPVILQFDPGKALTFPPCHMGEHSDILCIVKNQSISLPVMYHFQKTAHFKMDPERGKIDEGCIQVS